jgi:hypothetical protein
MGLLDLAKKERRSSEASNQSISSMTAGVNSAAGGASGQAPSGNPNDTEVLDKEEGNLLLALISQSERPSLCILAGPPSEIHMA